MELEQMWESALSEMQVQLSRANFATWLKNSQLVDRKDGTFYVAVPSTFAKRWVEDKYQKNILGILRNMDTSVKKIEFVIGSESSPLKRPAPPVMISTNDTQLMDLDFKTDPETGLNPRYQLSSYVVGSSNELAFAAAEAIVDHVGKKYNPFFVYGGVGLGKTHLIQGIGNAILARYEHKLKARYISCEQFGRDVVWGIRNKRMEDVKRKYRDIDVLIVDDIQFIGGKDKMEEEFFHTFNSLYENNKQIIITSDQPPHALPILQERLRSRFQAGFVADIAYPEFEVRVAIIRAKLDEANRQLSDDVINVIARRLKKNVREIEGVLKKILFEQQRKQVEITVDMAELRSKRLPRMLREK
jgi:chromosomal replication initiator protein